MPAGSLLFLLRTGLFKGKQKNSGSCSTEPRKGGRSRTYALNGIQSLGHLPARMSKNQWLSGFRSLRRLVSKNFIEKTTKLDTRTLFQWSQARQLFGYPSVFPMDVSHEAPNLSSETSGDLHFQFPWIEGSPGSSSRAFLIHLAKFRNSSTYVALRFGNFTSNPSLTAVSCAF